MKVLHVSIPKNGGTYIATNIAKNFKGKTFVVDEYRVKLSEFLPNIDQITTNYDFVAGHFPFKLVRAHAHKFDLIVSSYREPWTRAWSAFHYVTTHDREWAPLKAEGPADVPEKFSEFLTRYYLNNRFSRNSQCGFLGEANLPAAALANIDKFDIQMLPCDRLGESLQALMASVGLTFGTKAPRNESDYSAGALREGDNAEIDQKIHSWFDGDFELWRALDKREEAKTKAA